MTQLVNVKAESRSTAASDAVKSGDWIYYIILDGDMILLHDHRTAHLSKCVLLCRGKGVKHETYPRSPFPSLTRSHF